MPIKLTPLRLKNFWRRVQKTDTCWLWQGSFMEQGYGKLSTHTSYMSAHRVSWVIHYGPIPEGLFVCHKCDVRACVRPDHLFLGTQADNLADMRRKGRQGKTGLRGERNGRALLTEEQVLVIRRRFAAGEGCYSLGLEYGVSDTTIGAVVSRQNWRHLP